MAHYTKDPDATAVDYTIDWSDYLGVATISASTWSVDPAGLTIVDDTAFTGTTATVIVSGGDKHKAYRLTNQVTTSASIVDQRSVTVRVEEQ